MPARRIAVENRLEALTVIYAGVERFARENGLSDGTRRTLLLILEELFTNIVRHGYDRDVADRIVLTLERRDDGLRVVIRDHAKAFDMAAPPKGPPGSQGLAGMQPGGLGLVLVHRYARSIAARREGDTNITELLLAVEESG